MDSFLISLWLTSVVLPITSLTDIQKLNFLHFGVLYSLEICLFFYFFALFLHLLVHNYASVLASHLSDTWRLICLLKWSGYEVTAFLGYFGNTRVRNAYLRIYCCIGSASRKWTAFLLYSSFIFAYLLLYWVGQQKMNGVSSLLFVHICVFIVVLGRPAENERRFFSTLRSYLRIYCCIGSASRKWTAFLLYSSFIFAYLLLYWVGQQKMNGVSSLLFVHICVFIVVLGRPAENERRFFSTLRSYLRIYCCIGSASRKWTAFLLYSSFIFAYLLLYWVGQQKMNGLSSLLFVHICVFIVVLGRPAENERRFFSTLRSYLRIYCCIGSASRKWTAFLLYSSFIFAYLLLYWVGQQKMNGLSSLLFVHICVFIVVLGRPAENERPFFSTLRLHLERGDDILLFSFSTLPKDFATT